MPMKFLKKLHDHLPKEGLKMALHRSMAGMDTPHKIDTVHASDVTRDVEFCPREFCLLDVTGKKRKGGFVGTSLRYTFDLGRAMEYQLQNKWAAHLAVGVWKCPCCKRKTSFAKKPVGKCTNCNWAGWEYVETRFKSEVSGISCGVDLLVKLPGEPLLRVVEAKSLDKDIWIKLLAPEQEHRLRTNLYLRIIAESKGMRKDMVNLKEGIVLYMMKGFGKKDDGLIISNVKDAHFSPFKEFFIKRDDSQTQKGHEQALKVKRFREVIKILPGGICPTSTCKRAKSCSVKTECFSGNYPKGGVL